MTVSMRNAIGWLFFFSAACSAKTYTFNPGLRTWTQARDYCVSQGLQLATMSTAAEHSQAFATAHAASFTGNVWIGLLRPFTTWVDGTSVQATFWGSGEPNNSGGNEDCVHLRALGPGHGDIASGRGWNDVKCSNTFATLCESAVPTVQSEYVCKSSGDPHYTLFDGSRHDYQGRNQYHLLRCAGKCMNIQARHTPYLRNTRASLQKEMAVSIGNVVFKLTEIGAFVGQNPLPAGGLTVNSNGCSATITRSGSHYQVLYSDANRVDLFHAVAGGQKYINIEVRVNSEAYGVTPNAVPPVCDGLCGAVASANPYLDPASNPISGVNPFGNSWRVTSGASDDLFTRPNTNVPSDWSEDNTADPEPLVCDLATTDAVLVAAKAKCENAGFAGEEALCACMLDVGVGGDDDFLAQPNLLPNTCPNACSNHGNCNQGTCACFAGWSGADCSVPDETSAPPACDNVDAAGQCPGTAVTAPQPPAPCGSNCPEYKCQATGDPHYVTFAGNVHHYQGLGQYWLARCASRCLQVQTKHAPYNRNPRASLQVEVAVRVGRRRFYLRDAGAFVGGQALPAGGVVLSSQGCSASIRRSANGNDYYIDYDDGATVRLNHAVAGGQKYINVYITVDGAQYPVVANVAPPVCDGLCGAIGHDNPFLGRSSNAIAGTNPFGNAWAISSADVDLFVPDGEPSPSSGPVAPPGEPLDCDTNEPAIAAALVTCQEHGITDPIALCTCAADVGVGGDEFIDQPHQQVNCPACANGVCSNAACSCFDGWSGALCDQADATHTFGNLVCEVPKSEWLVTEFAPELNAEASGFNVPGTKDKLRIVYEYHRKYYGVTPSSGPLSEATGELAVSVEEETATIITENRECWNTYTVDVDWSDMVTQCARSEEGGATGFVVYTCKLEIDAMETLDPIRGQAIPRSIHNELPFVIKFPKQATAAVTDLSAFAPVNVLAAIIRQVVSLDVSDVTDVDAKIRLFTSTQYPFRLKLGSQTLNTLPADITEDSFANAVDCVDPEQADAPNPTVNDALACSQEWVLDFQVDSAVRCDIDGDYQVQFQAECYPFFNGQADCPLVKDDLGQTDDIFTVNFKIDSEDFCAKVVDSVDVSATLTVWKDHAHSVSASNFIQGQTAYFVAAATSSKVTIVSLSVDDIDVEITGGPNAGSYDFYTDGVANAANPAGLSLVVENSNANGNPAQAWFQHVVAADPFAAPVDGSSDFDVSVVLNVVFKDAALGLLSERSFLLQGSQQLATNVQAAVGPEGDDTVTAAAAREVVAGGAAAFSVVFGLL